MTEGGIGRWATKAEDSPVQTRVSAPSRMSQGREAAAVSRGRADAAMTIANMAMRAARERLNHYRRTRQSLAGAAAAIGAAGIVVSVILIDLNPDDTHTRLALASLAAFAACAPFAFCVMRAKEGADKETEMAVAVECTRLLAVQAKQLGETVEAAADQNGLSSTAQLVIDMLLDDVEKAAANARRREHRIRGETNAQGRRHVRIYPRNSRVVVAAGDNRRFAVNILDVSQSGVAVEGDLPGIAVGCDVVVGSRRAKVVRLLPHGAAFEFAKLIPAELFNRDIVL